MAKAGMPAITNDREGLITYIERHQAAIVRLRTRLMLEAPIMSGDCIDLLFETHTGLERLRMRMIRGLEEGSDEQ